MRGTRAPASGPSRRASWGRASPGHAGSSPRRRRGWPRRTRSAPRRSRETRPRTGWTVMPSASQIGTGGATRSPAAAQCTTTASGAIDTSTLVEPDRARARRCGCGRDGRRSRSCATGPSSHWARVGVLAIVGSTSLVDPQHHARRLEPKEHVVQRWGLGRGFHCVGDHADEDGRVRLDHGAVQHPRVPGAHPADRVRSDAVAEQPDARVGRGLAGADDDVLLRSVRPTPAGGPGSAVPGAAANGGGVVAGISGSR